MRNQHSSELLSKEFNEDVAMSDRLSFTMRARSVIRAAQREGRAVLQLEGAISRSLNAEFAAWLHNDRTSSWLRLVCMLIVYTLWGAAPWVTTNVLSPGDFVVLLGQLDFTLDLQWPDYFLYWINFLKLFSFDLLCWLRFGCVSGYNFYVKWTFAFFLIPIPYSYFDMN